MRPRGSITGPLILITLGCLFLVHTISPDFEIFGLVSRYWPYFLIFWGVLQLIEVSLRALRSGPLPPSGISGVSWGIVLLIVFVGYGTWQWHRPETWWHRAGLDQSLALIGDSHDYSFDLIRRPVGRAPRVVIESFRGDAKVTGTDGSEVTITGHKNIRALDVAAAENANRQSGVEAVVQGNTVIIRCNQDRIGSRTQVSTDLEISVPKDTVLEATGKYGDFDVSGIKDIDVSSDNAGVRVQNIAGDVKIDTRKGDQVRCTKVNGTVTLRGHGEDVELSQVTGQVSVVGDYSGTITLRDISDPVRIESMRTQFEAQAVPGTLSLQRGSLEAENTVGPVKVAARSTDVSLSRFSDTLDLTVDKGDIDLKPASMPLSKMTVHTHSGNVTLALPERANFALTATAAHGEIENEFGNELKAQQRDEGSSLEGSVGSGPQVTVVADHGGINVQKDDGSDTKTSKRMEPPKAPRPPSGPQI